jgi:predicted restriction endonuclease
MVRQIRYRDRGCRFPGCGTAAFTQAHHIRWWRHGGRTDLDNLLLICSSTTASSTSSGGP